MPWSIRPLPKAFGPRALLNGALTATLAFGLLSEAQAACKLQEISEFHVQRVANAPIIDGRINGQPVRILLETGSFLSFVTLTAARQLQLPVREYASRTALSDEGTQGIQTADVKELQIGRLALKDYTVGVMGTEIHDGNGVASFQLGADFLSNFTTEFDLAHDAVRILHTQDCKLEQLAYWSPTYFQIPLEDFDPHGPSFIISIKVNGRPLRARLVSGAAKSYISLDAAKETGVDPNGPGVEPAEPSSSQRQPRFLCG